MSFPDDPWAGMRKPALGPRTVSTTAASALPGGGMTLDALMARQKELAGKTVPMTEMRSPMQGVAYALQEGLQGFKEGRADRDVAEAQGVFSDALGKYVAGDKSPENMALIGRYDPATMVSLWEKSQKQFGPVITGEQATQLGLDGTKRYQQNLQTGQWDPIDSGGITFDASQKGENKWAETNAANLSKLYDGIAQEGAAAEGKLNDIGQLELLLKGGVPTGMRAQLLEYFQQNWGVNIEGADKVTAFNTIISRLVPSQRTPGSGQMSDKDVALFKASLPQLSSTPEGIALVIAGMKGMTEWNRRVGIIASEAQDQPDPASAKKYFQNGVAALRKSFDPLADLKKALEGQGGDTSNPDQPPQKPHKRRFQ